MEEIMFNTMLLVIHNRFCVQYKLHKSPVQKHDPIRGNNLSSSSIFSKKKKKSGPNKEEKRLKKRKGWGGVGGRDILTERRRTITMSNIAP